MTTTRPPKKTPPHFVLPKFASIEEADAWLQTQWVDASALYGMNMERVETLGGATYDGGDVLMDAVTGALWRYDALMDRYKRV